jgi:cytochrome c oxidase subunit II
MIRRFVLMAVLALAAASVLPRLARAQSPEPRVVAITAKKFEFSPAEVTLKRGEPVTLRLTSLDRDHGFFAKQFAIDADIHPGQPTDVTITPTEAGRFTVICDDYCGFGHGNMKMVIVVE